MKKTILFAIIFIFLMAFVPVDINGEPIDSTSTPEPTPTRVSVERPTNTPTPTPTQDVTPTDTTCPVGGDNCKPEPTGIGLIDFEARQKYSSVPGIGLVLLFMASLLIAGKAKE